MRAAVGNPSTNGYDIEAVERAAKEGDSSKLAEGSEAVCIFVNDVAGDATLRVFHAGGTKVLLLRCAGYDIVNLQVAKELDMTVLRVPAYSPYAVADHTAALMLTLKRKIHRSYNRTLELNFRLEGLLGFDINGKTVGVVGTGKIGALFARIVAGFGCKVLAYDIKESPDALRFGAEYVSQGEVWARSDIISLHCPLLPSTKHVINAENIAKMKHGVMLITRAAKEGPVFITGHQAFFTQEALDNIGHTTIENFKAYEAKAELVNEVKQRSIAHWLFVFSKYKIN
ncbi:hypothetical protein PsorP6_015301 [Peronosclerospora sorghi]|uniref:Uncharacterized protein n=1 Tax=Peronosclerospora sorghi TaxID=230839 RepID=A0ACC0VUQ1_9STRA|nr:hypothetical protein PsorP6_015301 [Peronosclerospora sorghi]